ncbi:bZIP transcription factor atfC [Aspergillus clavatus NRRL 1]|uniref:BZIP transcription factor (BACH2), putative n=1 Tax=Aspergillus clavatus (strain ATCC 1007 / CBS 513.65 / DSM 816 / NCTC 3887 / NRRL 1 / QM 1276 / 107) TaxID=344612 RepID=A1CN89_ASPCL|nr:bZIP transcription factor (BACH2), putative [Aspergillus clavatus NRRL 1]EAW07110.1 bZIP transcription factor (BACH2), putative [Aspergillus clavatus NRRL 1]
MTTAMLAQQPSLGAPNQLVDWSMFNPNTLSLQAAPASSAPYPSAALLTEADLHVLNLPLFLQKSTDVDNHPALDPLQIHSAELKPTPANHHDAHSTRSCRASISSSSSIHSSITTGSETAASKKATKPKRPSKSKIYAPDDPLRERYLERNRRAATKCRRQKKERNQQLETLYHKQSADQERLLSERDRMRSELLTLKDELLKHAQCEDPSLKCYLAQMVEDVGARRSASYSSASSYPTAGMPPPQPLVFTDEEMQSLTRVGEVPWTIPGDFVDFAQR